MKQVEISQHCECIAGMVSEHPEGIGISALQQALAVRCGNINRRTLQRRLVRLVRDERIPPCREYPTVQEKPLPAALCRRPWAGLHGRHAGHL